MVLHELVLSVHQIFIKQCTYRKDTEPLYHFLMYSLVSLLSGIYPLLAMHSLLVTLYVTEYFVGTL